MFKCENYGDRIHYKCDGHRSPLQKLIRFIGDISG